MLTQHLIESALALTGKTMEDMEIVYTGRSLAFVFSIEKFCYYLLSPEFLIAYNHKMIDIMQKQHWGSDIGGTIAEYQSGNEDPLIELLSKIGN